MIKPILKIACDLEKSILNVVYSSDIIPAFIFFFAACDSDVAVRKVGSSVRLCSRNSPQIKTKGQFPRSPLLQI